MPMPPRPSSRSTRHGPTRSPGATVSRIDEPGPDDARAVLVSPNSSAGRRSSTDVGAASASSSASTSARTTTLSPVAPASHAARSPSGRESASWKSCCTSAHRVCACDGACSSVDTVVSRAGVLTLSWTLDHTGGSIVRKSGSRSRALQPDREPRYAHVSCRSGSLVRPGCPAAAAHARAAGGRSCTGT